MSSVRLDETVDVDGKYRDFMAAHDAVGMVMRPDYYLFGGATTTESLSALVDQLIATLDDHGFHLVPHAGDIEPQAVRPRQDATAS